MKISLKVNDFSNILYDSTIPLEAISDGAPGLVFKMQKSGLQKCKKVVDKRKICDYYVKRWQKKGKT